MICTKYEVHVSLQLTAYSNLQAKGTKCNVGHGAGLSGRCCMACHALLQTAVIRYRIPQPKTSHNVK